MAELRSNDKMRLDETLGKNIRRIRTLKKMSREELATIIGLTVSHVGLIERGARGATAVTLEKLSHIFGIPIDTLFQPLESTNINPKAGQISDLMKQVKAQIATLTEDECMIVSHTIQGILKLRIRNKQ